MTSAAPLTCGLCGGSGVCTPAGSGMARPCPSCRPESYGPARVYRAAPFADPPPIARPSLRAQLGAVAPKRFR